MKKSPSMSFWQYEFVLKTMIFKQKCIENVPEGWSGPCEPRSLSFLPMRVPLSMLGFELAGEPFERKYGCLRDELAQASGGKRAKGAAKAADSGGIDEDFSGTAKKRKAASTGAFDPYDALGLSETRWRASQDQIKKAYRKLILTHHPDKQGGGTGDDTRFKLIQRAWDTLGTVEKRRVFDSSEPWDPSIPGADLSGSDPSFYEVYGDAFARWSRWSSRRPVPQFGGATTPLKSVSAFYDFWMGFQSWKDYKHLGEYDEEEASSRDERRWMERQNESERKAARKRDGKYVRDLVQNAYAQDPRVKEIMRLQKEKEERELQRRVAKLHLQTDEKRQKDVQRQKEAEEARRRREAEAETRKRELRAQLAEALARVGLQPTAPELEALTRGMSEMQLHADMAKPDTAASRLREMRRHKEEQARKSSAEARSVKKRTWTAEELAALTRAMVKYPNGTANRWEKVAAVLGNRSKEEVLAKAKEVAKAGMQRQDAGIPLKDDFQRYQEKKKSLNRDVDVDVTTRVPVSAGQSPGAAAAAATAWSVEEQKSLETALRKYPASLGAAERWEKISNHVGTKSKKECVERYKELVQKLKKK